MNHFRRSIGKGKREVARVNLSIVAVVSGLVLITVTVGARQPPTAFHIYDWVKYNNETTVLGPNVTITNLNTTPSPEVFNAEKNMSYDYYQLTISSYDVNASDVLRFNASDNGDNSFEFNLSVTGGNMTDGGLFVQNITIPVGRDVDLKINDVWVCWPDNCTICYNITNTGKGTAPAGHNTTLYVDSNEIDIVPVTLAPNASAIRCFNYTWNYTHDDDGHAAWMSDVFAIFDGNLNCGCKV